MKYDEVIEQLQADNLAMRALLNGLLKELEAEGHDHIVENVYAKADAILDAAVFSLDLEILDRFASKPGQIQELDQLVKNKLRPKGSAND